MLSFIEAMKRKRIFHRIIVIAIACTFLHSPGFLPTEVANAGAITTDGLVINYDHSSFTAGSSTVTNLVAGKTDATLRSNASTSTPTMGGSSSRNYFTTTASSTPTTWNNTNNFIYTNTGMNAATFGSATNVSAFAWIYPTTANHVVLDERGSNYGFRDWYDTQIEMVNQVYKFRVWNCSIIANPSTTSLNNWHYVGFTYNDATKTLTGYVDGLSVVSGPCSRSAPFGSYNLFYGVGTNGGTDMDGDPNRLSTGGFQFGALHVYNRALAANEVSTNASTKITQTLTLSSLGTSSKTYPYSQALNMSTSGSSGSGAITYSVANGTASGCALSNNSSTATITATTEGTCSVTATIASDSFFDAATSAAVQFTFAKASQTLSFATTSYSKAFGETQTVLAASAGSGLITYSAGASTACSLSGAVVTITAVTGTCVITASRAADANYLAATSTNGVTITVSKAAQSAFTFVSTSGTFLTNLLLSTSGGSGLGAVSYSVGSPNTAGCSVTSGDSLTAASAGSCTVVAKKESTADYLVAYDTRTVTIGKASLTFVASAAASLKYGSNSSVTYTTSRSLGGGSVPNLTGTLSYETSTSTACTVDSSTGLVTMRNSSGTCRLRVTLANDTNYSDTSSALISITPVKADAISLTAANKTSIYTGSASAITPTYSVTGLQFSDTVTVTYNYSGTANGGANYSLSATKPTNAGAYSIIPSVTLTNADSYTAPSVNVTNGTLTISRATRTLSATNYSSTSLKYGDTATVTSNVTSPSSNSDGTFSYLVGSGCSINSSTGEIAATTFSGSCVETTTVTQGNNYETATATAITFTLSKADTLTVTTATPAALNYTGAAAAVTPTITVSGLVAGNTATGATFSYSRTPNCASGGTCQIGDTGPGGGKVFYVSGSAINAATGISKGGIYLEMAPATFSKTMYNWCEGPPNPNTTVFGASGTAIGTGASNTKIMTDNCTGGAGFEAVNLTLGGQTDWFLPSFAELQVIYSLRNSLGLSSGDAASGFLYWSSTEFDYLVAASLVPWAGVGGQNKGQATPYMPIRAFSATVSVYSTSVTAPTNAGSYVITPSALALSDGITTDYYKAVVYEMATLTVNKASQSAFTNFQTLSGVFGSAFAIYKFGGSGDGEETISVANGTASGCSLNGTLLTSLTEGTCLITATKATSENYLEAASSFTVILYYYVPEPVATVSTMPTQIAIAATNGWSINPSIGPTIVGISPSSGPVGTVITITGTGMNGVDVIKIGRKVLTLITGINETSVTGVIPVGATTGPILVSNALGSHFLASGFTVTTP